MARSEEQRETHGIPCQQDEDGDYDEDFHELDDVQLQETPRTSAHTHNLNGNQKVEHLVFLMLFSIFSYQ